MVAKEGILLTPLWCTTEGTDQSWRTLEKGFKFPKLSYSDSAPICVEF